MEQGVHVGQATKDGGARTVPAGKMSSDAKPSRAVVSNEFIDGTIQSEASLYPLTTLTSQDLRSREFLIRALDIVGSVAIILLTVPLMLAVVLLIKIFSGGGVLYKQKRVGKNGKIFTLCKFRTMINNSEEHTGPVWAAKDDSRVTPIGRVLRTTRLDELPQLFNVMLGDMSLVGPRPPTLDEVARYEKWQDWRLEIKPGITCLWQIYARDDKSFDNWVRLDIEYIERRSLLLDLKILFNTVPAVLSCRGAC